MLQTITSDYTQHPESFNARSLCQVILNTNADRTSPFACLFLLESLSKEQLLSMLKHFTLLCSKPGAVKPMDLLNTVTALVPYAKSQKSLVAPITISMGVSSWIGCKGNSVSPQLMSNLLLFLAKMGAKSAPLIDLFDSKLAKKLGDFQDEVLFGVE